MLDPGGLRRPRSRLDADGRAGLPGHVRADGDRGRVRRQARRLPASRSLCCSRSWTWQVRQAHDDAQAVLEATGPTSGTYSRVKIGAEERRHDRRRRRLPRLRSRRLPRLAGGGRRDVCARAVPDPQRPHRGLRRRGQQAEGRGLPRTRGTGGGVRRRVRRRRARAAARAGPDGPAAQERLEGRLPARRRRGLRRDRQRGGDGGRQELRSLPLRASGREPRARRRDGLLVQHRPGIQRLRQREPGRDREPRARIRRHRRHAHLDRDAARRNARHHRRGGQAPGRGHRLRRLHERDGRQPHHVRGRLGRLRGGDGHPAARWRSAPPRIWEVDRDQVSYGDDGAIHGPADGDGNERSFTFKELAGQLPGSAA